jgi:hypothetical protein
MRSDAEPLLNVLTAYPYASAEVINVVAANQNHIRFVLDSGAFTAWKAGKPIALDDYCRFIESLPFKPWRYFALDVIGDPHASMANYEMMLRRGFNPVPIFTRGEDPAALDEYFKTSDVVGIGGLVGTPQYKGFVNGIMKHMAGRRVHWLGFTSMEFIKSHRPYMCDSSSWMRAARFATQKLYVGCGRELVCSKASFGRKPKPELIEAVRRLGFDPALLASNAGWAGQESPSRKLAAASGIARSLDVQKNLGTLEFLATPTGQYITLLIEQYLNLRKRYL